MSPRLLAAVAAAVYVLACVFSIGGLTDARPWGDVGNYERYGSSIVEGGVPYHDFYMEYPPGAIPVFVAPAARHPHQSSAAYLIRFKVLMTICGLGALLAAAAALVRLRADRLRWLVALTAIRLWRTTGRRGLVEAAVAFCAVGLAAFGYFAVVAPGGLGFSLYTQIRRHLQTESLGASILLALDRLGLYHARIIPGDPGSIDLGGFVPDAVGIITSLVALAAVAVVALAYWHGEEDAERFTAAFAASITAFTAFAKVISPQFLVWLVPLVPLVRGAAGRIGAAILLVALLLTQIENYGFVHLTIATWAVWLILVRNLLLVALFALLLRELAPALRQRTAAALHAARAGTEARLSA